MSIMGVRVCTHNSEYGLFSHICAVVVVLHLLPPFSSVYVCVFYFFIFVLLRASSECHSL